jgi:hypothetical protein
MEKKIFKENNSEFQNECLDLLGKIEKSIPINDYLMQKEIGVLTNLISKIYLYGNEIQLANAKIAFKASLTGSDNGNQLEIIQNINGKLSKDINNELYNIRSQYNVGVLFIIGIFFIFSIITYIFEFVTKIGHTKLSLAIIFAAFFSAACGHLVKSSNDSFINEQMILNRPFSIIRGIIQTLSTALFGVFFTSVLFPIIEDNLLTGGMWEAWTYILMAGFGGWLFIVSKHDILSIFREKEYFHSKSKNIAEN